MTEETPNVPIADAAAKKATTKKTTARKTTAKKPSARKRQIALVGNSRGGKHGDRRTVDESVAERLVREGLARFVGSSGS